MTEIFLYLRTNLWSEVGVQNNHICDGALRWRVACSNEFVHVESHAMWRNHSYHVCHTLTSNLDLKIFSKKIPPIKYCYFSLLFDARTLAEHFRFKIGFKIGQGTIQLYLHLKLFCTFLICNVMKGLKWIFCFVTAYHFTIDMLSCLKVFGFTISL